MTTEGNVFVVVGSPGAGKSALLAQLAACHRGGLDAILDARAAGVEVVARQLALLLDMPVDEVRAGIEFARAIAKRGRGFSIVVDGLDEATVPESIAEQLLAPLATVPRCKMIVGASREFVGLIDNAVVLDLDQHPPHPTELATYVRRRLLCDREPNRRTPYRSAERLAHDIASAVASRPGTNFLYARTVVEMFLAMEGPIDVRAHANWGLPGTTEVAFQWWMEALGPKRWNVEGVLTTLAFAQGLGLPFEDLLPRLTSAVSGKPYSDRDVDDALTAGAPFISVIENGGRSLYRLHHDVYARVLRARCDEASVHRSMADVLRESTLASGGAIAPMFAHPYVRQFHKVHERLGYVAPPVTQHVEAPQLHRELPRPRWARGALIGAGMFLGGGAAAMAGKHLFFRDVVLPCPPAGGVTGSVTSSSQSPKDDCPNVLTTLRVRIDNRTQDRQRISMHQATPTDFPDCTLNPSEACSTSVPVREGDFGIDIHDVPEPNSGKEGSDVPGRRGRKDAGPIDASPDRADVVPRATDARPTDASEASAGPRITQVLVQGLNAVVAATRDSAAPDSSPAQADLQ